MKHSAGEMEGLFKSISEYLMILNVISVHLRLSWAVIVVSCLVRDGDFCCVRVLWIKPRLLPVFISLVNLFCCLCRGQG